MTHFFDVEVATLLGVDAAVMIENLRYWIKFNQANKRHCYEGRTWTYNSNKAFTELFPYYTSKQIRTILDKLEAKGILLKGNFNQSGYDRTTWYAFTSETWLTEVGTCICPNGQMETPEKAEGNAHQGEPIPINNTDKKPVINKRGLPFEANLTPEVILPWDTEDFRAAWLRWKNYKWKQHNFKYKTIDSEQQALITLSKECDGLEDVALDAIPYSIGKGWAGIYKNKSYRNGNGNNQNGKITGSDVGNMFANIDKAFAGREPSGPKNGN